MEDLDQKFNAVYTALIDGIGTATIYAGNVQDLRLRKIIYDLLAQEAKHAGEFRKRLFALLGEN